MQKIVHSNLKETQIEKLRVNRMISFLFFDLQRRNYNIIINLLQFTKVHANRET